MAFTIVTPHVSTFERALMLEGILQGRVRFRARDQRCQLHAMRRAAMRIEAMRSAAVRAG